MSGGIARPYQPSALASCRHHPSGTVLPAPLQVGTSSSAAPLSKESVRGVRASLTSPQAGAGRTARSVETVRTSGRSPRPTGIGSHCRAVSPLGFEAPADIAGGCTSRGRDWKRCATCDSALCRGTCVVAACGFAAGVTSSRNPNGGEQSPMLRPSSLRNARELGPSWPTTRPVEQTVSGGYTVRGPAPSVTPPAVGVGRTRIGSGPGFGSSVSTAFPESSAAAGRSPVVAPGGAVSRLWVEVDLEPATAPEGQKPQLRVTVSAASTMKQVREAVARKLAVDVALVQLIASSRVAADGSGERFAAFEDAELLGERRRLRVLGVDLAGGEGRPRLVASPTAPKSTPAMASRLAATCPAAERSPTPTVASADAAAQQAAALCKPAVGQNELCVSQGGNAGRSVTLQGVASSWTMLHVRQALAQKLARPDLVTAGRLVRRSDDGRMSSLLDTESVGSLRFGDQVLLIGADLVEGPWSSEVLRQKSAAGAKMQPTVSSVTAPPLSPQRGGAPEFEKIATGDALSPRVGAARAVATPLTSQSLSKVLEPTQLAASEGRREAQAASPSKPGMGRPQLHFGYVCPECGVGGLPDLASATRHCDSGAPPPVVRQRAASPVPRSAPGETRRIVPSVAPPSADAGAATAPSPLPPLEAVETPSRSAGAFAGAPERAAPPRSEAVGAPAERSVSRDAASGYAPARAPEPLRPTVAPPAPGPALATAAALTATALGGRAAEPEPTERPAQPGPAAAMAVAAAASAAISALARAVGPATPPEESPASAGGASPVGGRLAAWNAEGPRAEAAEAPRGASVQAPVARPEEGAAGARLVVGPTGLVPTAPPLKGEPVAYSEFGFPTIVRQVDDESGQARTIVQNEDGSHKVFGANTISSLTGSADDDAKRWLNALRNREMHGLVHELGKRLVGASQQYQQQRIQLEQLAHRGHYEYFGLQQGASEKEVHTAYRRMAKRMHPDKNGGTDEAKKKFQHMKERYERLKERFKPVESTASTAASRDEAPAEDPESQPEPEDAGEKEPQKEDAGGGSGGGGGSGSSGSASGEEAADAGNDDGDEERSPGGRCRRKDRSKERRGRNRSGGSTGSTTPNRRSDAASPGGAERRREAYEEDEPDEESQARNSGGNSRGGRIAYDPADRSSLDETVWKMLEQMRRLQQGLDSVTAELRRAGGA